MLSIMNKKSRQDPDRKSCESYAKPRPKESNQGPLLHYRTAGCNRKHPVSASRRAVHYTDGESLYDIIHHSSESTSITVLEDSSLDNPASSITCGAQFDPVT